MARGKPVLIGVVVASVASAGVPDAFQKTGGETGAPLIERRKRSVDADR